jgi:phenylalanyl-tRNA synthetase alpha chain
MIFDELWAEFSQELKSLETNVTAEVVQGLKVSYLGKKGKVSGLMKQMGGLNASERPQFGKKVNDLKAQVAEAIEVLADQAEAAKLSQELAEGYTDVSQKGRGIPAGSLHPINVVRDQIIDFFTGLGFAVEDGREVETDWYNFEALNIPPEHPARDTQDTFYVDKDIVLRTQTSDVQVHVMENQKPPIRMIAPGKVYRVDHDATHAPMFHQVEGLVVDEEISFAQLKGILYMWVKEVFGESAKIRFRPHYFPFTEPSAEMDVFFDPDGKGGRWMEIGGCGSVDPAVFEKLGIDPDRYTGFAFGFGIDRITMVKYGIPEIGLLTANDNRFLSQF